MSKELTLTVDPRLTDSTKIRSILRTNPPPHTICRRHYRLFRLIAVCLYEARLYGMPVSSEAPIYHVINHFYID